MPAPEVIRVDADGVMYFEHPRGALLDYSVNLVDDPSGSALGSATVASKGVTITPALGLLVGNGALTYATPTPPGGGSLTPAAPSEAAGVVTFWLWSDPANLPAIGAEFLVEAWYRTTGPSRVTRALLRIRIT